MVVYKKTNFNTKPKTVEQAFLEQHFIKEDVRNCEARLSVYGITGTKLIIKQDSTDNITKLKNSILNEIGNNTVQVDEKEQHVKELETRFQKMCLTTNRFCWKLKPSFQH